MSGKYYAVAVCAVGFAKDCVKEFDSNLKCSAFYYTENGNIVANEYNGDVSDW